VPDPVQATLWLSLTAVTVLMLCLGGTLLAAGMRGRLATQRHSPRQDLGKSQLRRNKPA
jgi:hypothetical protein